MPDIRQLFRDLALEHSNKPRKFSKLETASRWAEGYNPLCGDRITVYLKLEEDVVENISFTGTGCTISTASASMMTVGLTGRSAVAAEAFFEAFHRLLTQPSHPTPGYEQLGELVVFSLIREYPVRIKCAGLAWHTFHTALHGNGQLVSTK